MMAIQKTECFARLFQRCSLNMVIKIIMIRDRNMKERKKMKTMMKGFLGTKIVFYLKDTPPSRIFEGQQIFRTSITSQVGKSIESSMNIYMK